MSAPAVLAIDQGTSGTKAIVVDGDGAVLALAEVPVHTAYLPGGRVEQDPFELLASVLAAGRRAEEVCAGLAGHAERVAELTGLVLDPYFSASKMTWIRRTALPAEGCLSAGDAKCTYGTGAFLLANTGERAVR
ncbi:FGGY family carbohydrate kinase [Microbispora sp. H11081]|uniref:FGGY family carbohydrate kinase n=1 Tax=Microbispora sp. H11081 TaxID=2729107 RepID=UPI001473826D|nr:FGGY family carbohydrate kinase [Microbispora sp. H11081]